MKRYTYPAVFYYDEEYNDYAVEFSDICIYAEGNTMEEAYKNAQDYLVAYLDCCAELEVAPNKPNTYESTLKDHPNGRIMLVTVDYEPKVDVAGKTETPQETFTNLNDDILVENEEQEEKLVLKEVEKFQKEREAALNNRTSDDGDDDDGDDGDDDFSLPEVE